MSSSFERQLKFSRALVDSFGRLTAEALLDNKIDYAMSLARTFSLARKFYDSRIWYEWKCSTYEIFVKKFYECCEKGEV